MYKTITLCIFILKIHSSTTQFPDHIDLQKVGEIIFNNERFNILKPSTHIITDYFKEFMLRRTSEFPTKRVFIDDNGFRHIWSGFNVKSENLRKTDVDVTKDTEIVSKLETNETDSEKQVANVTSDTILNADVMNNDDVMDKDDDANNNDGINNDEDLTEVTESITYKATPKRKITTPHWSYYKPAVLLRDDKLKSAPNKKPAERTVAKTTFFCPFFGVMTMSAFID